MLHKYTLICIIVALRLIFPSRQAIPQHNDDALVLKKIHLFNKTISQHEQTKWFLPDQFPALQSFNRNFNSNWSAIQNPDNKRVEPTLLKAFHGEDVNIVVYGGSNTAAGLFPLIIQQWWDKNIFPISGSVLKVRNVAMGGTSSIYFQFCYDIYLDKGEDVDLVILELSINDAFCDIQNSSIPKSLPFEQFTRELLNRPNKPSVLVVNLYTLLFHGETPQCVNLMDFDQNQVVHNYNITAINLRNLVCSFKMGKYYATQRTYDLKENGGTWHINSKGHAQTAFLIIQVILRTLKKIIFSGNTFKNSTKSYTTSTTTSIPARNSHIAIETPQCWSRLTPDYKNNVLRNTLEINVIKSKGFVYRQGIRIRKTSFSSTEERKDAFGGFLAEEQGSKITISFTVVGSSFPRSVGIISRSLANGGEVEIWLDEDNSKRTYVKLNDQGNQTIMRIIGTQMTPGNHTITMHVVKSGISVIVGVVVGPANGLNFTESICQ